MFGGSDGIFQTSGHDFNGVRSTSRAAYAEDGASILQLISFQKTWQKMEDATTFWASHNK